MNKPARLLLCWLLAFAAEAAPVGKLLFLGNSITLHGPKADIGWSGNWGMAATAAGMDYVHRVARGLGNPEVMVRNIADFERQYATYDIDTKLKEAFAFQADVVIVAIAENVPELATAGEQARFQNAVARLLRKLKAGNSPRIFVRSSFFKNKLRQDQILKQASEEAGVAFIDIGSLGREEANYARAEQKIAHAGVGAHPGDRGMAAIADAILRAIAPPRMKLGAYYFDGWAGRSALDDGAPDHAWAKGMPTHFTRKLAGEYSGRMPVWGWRDDTVDIMERQIDLAADHGVAFFSMCWYWRDNRKAINIPAIEALPNNTGVRLFMQAKNNHRMEFCLLVANHQGSEIVGAEAWKQAADFWITMFRHPRYLRMAGKPVLVIFSPRTADREGLAYLQTAARQAGFPGVEVAGCGAGSLEDGFTLRTRYNVTPPRTPNSQPSEGHAYQELIEANAQAWRGTPGQPFIPVATAGWDRRPWEGPGGLGANGAPISWYFDGATPAAFGGMLERMTQWMDANPAQVTKDRLALVYAWNEMGEGGWLVPTKDDPDGLWLKAIRRVVLEPVPSAKPAPPK